MYNLFLTFGSVLPVELPKNYYFTGTLIQPGLLWAARIILIIIAVIVISIYVYYSRKHFSTGE